MNVFVTGASRGIGLGLVERFLQRGDRVVATARAPQDSPELLALVESHPQLAHLVTLDVSDESSIGTALKETAALVDALDVVINNAGIKPTGGDVARGKGSRLGMLSVEPLVEVFRVNAVGALLVAQAAVPLLRKGHSPRVINITSAMGSIAETDSGGDYAYRVSKAAMNMVTRVLAADLRPAQIAVRSVHPGWVKTRMGGLSAPVEITDSVAGIVRLVDRTNLDNTGTFVNYDGRPYAW